jgi:hypothetical protein
MDFVGMETGAFKQLTCEYMADSFNPRTPDDESVRYYSYGASFEPHLLSLFRKSHRVIKHLEGPNDGLVSVNSSRWGTYCGTLNNVNHLDLINWTNRLRWYFWKLTGKKRNFNAIAFYLDIAGATVRSIPGRLFADISQICLQKKASEDLSTHEEIMWIISA